MVVLVYTEEQILRIGLGLIGVDRKRQKRQLPKTNVSDFKAHYGTEPKICKKIWEDLQTTTIPEAKLDATLTDGADIKNFL